MTVYNNELRREGRNGGIARKTGQGVIGKIFTKWPATGFSGYRILAISPPAGKQAFLRVLVMMKKRAQKKSPISKRREYLIKCILMRVPIENGLGFINQGIRFY